MKKQVILCGKTCTLENNALLPRRYRNQFGRDLIVDMQAMATNYKKDPSSFNGEVLENVTWLMLKEAGEDVGENPEEWLATLDNAFAVYEISGDVMGLWSKGRETTSRPKKK